MQEKRTEQVNREDSDKGFSVPKFAGFDQLPFRNLLPLAPFLDGFANTCQNMENTTSPTSCSDFNPITPRKPMRREIADQGRVLVKIPDLCRVQCIKGDQHVKESAVALAAAAAKGNINNEDGDNEAVEQIKTPEKPKRRKHRPKVITQAPKPKNPTPKPSCKRKYVRKKGVNQDSTSTPVEVSVQSGCLFPDKKACRVMNLEDEQPADENGNCKPVSSKHSETQGQGCCHEENQSSSKFRLLNEIGSVEINAYKRKCVRKKGVNKNSTSIPVEAGVQSGCPIPETKACRLLNLGDEQPRDENVKPASSIHLETQEQGCSHGENQSSLKFRLVNEIECVEDIASEITHSENQELKECLSSLAEGQAPRTHLPKKSKPTKRKRLASTLKQPNKDRRKPQKVLNNEGSVAEFMSQSGNSILTLTEGREAEIKQHDDIQDYQKFSWLYFTNWQNIKKGQSSPMFGMSKDGLDMDPSEQNSNCCFSDPQSCPILISGKVGQAQENKFHISESTKCSNQKENSMKKRPGDADLRYIPGQFPVNFNGGPQASTKAVTLHLQSTISKNKRTKKSQEPQMHGKTILERHYQFSATSADELWKQMSSLDINRESPYVPYQDMALVPYVTNKQDQNALVPCRGDDTIVLYSPVKKRHLRPKVNLDDETSKVWNLLMGNINSEGIDGTDEEKARWWDEERRLLRGRADSFIARMHLVQGDRRFTPWKGSVVDSVIGVFLTQNVSDHLSSSAFMSMAARFPFMSKAEEGGNSRTHEPLVCLDETEVELIPRVNNQSPITINNTWHNEEKVMNSDDRCHIRHGLVSSRDDSVSNIMNSSASSSDACNNSNAERSSKIFHGNEPANATPDLVLSQDSNTSSQQSNLSISFQNTETTGSCSEGNSEGQDQLSSFDKHPTFMELIQMAESSKLHDQGKHNITKEKISEDKDINIQAFIHDNHKESINSPIDPKRLEEATITAPGNHSFQQNSNQGSEAKSFNSFREEGTSPSEFQKPSCRCQQNRHVMPHGQIQVLEDPCNVNLKKGAENDITEQHVNLKHQPTAISDLAETTGSFNNRGVTEQKPPDPDSSEQGCSSHQALNQMNEASPKSKGKRDTKVKKDQFDWDSLRREAEDTKGKRETTESTMDSVDWEAVRTTDVDEIAKTIKDRGMNNVLAGRIQDFLNRIVREHGSIDLEWLRDVPPDKAKEYLLSIRGLGLKSVECVRLLTLHHLAFPVDTNVGRIAVRLGWVPLQPLPESLQLHLLELYPVQATIQKYLWPRLCKLDQRTLYELHYQMITFGKVFCTKSKPNCNACPMRGDCRHFASAFASARLALPGPQEKSIVGANGNWTLRLNQASGSDQGLLPFPPATEHLQEKLRLEEDRQLGSKNGAPNSEPIIEEPATPEPECIHVHDIEDAFWEDPDEIPTIRLNMEQFTSNLKTYMQQNMELQEGEMSNALVALTAEAASIPAPKLKNMSQLRTEHQVYELPDHHPLLEGLDKREPDDPCSYLLAIWTPGETADSIQPSDRKCRAQEDDELCDEFTCFSCSSIREARSQTVRGTLLIPCRTAMRGSFPLNGTYFQVNEVFADHDSSLNPIDVPRYWIWNLPRKTVYFGTSIPTIFKGLTTEGIQHCFWRGYVCVRGFDQKTRAPRPLMARLHFPVSKLSKKRGSNNADGTSNTTDSKLNPKQNK